MLRALALSCMLLVALTGCGTQTGPAPAGTSAPAPTEHGAYAHCLAEHGVTVSAGAPAGPAPGPAGPPPGVDQATWESAQEACAAMAPGPSS